MTELTPRLKKVYDMLGSGELIVDVGCDHAYLPIKLVGDGKYRRAISSDIVPGPLSAARTNIEREGLSERIVTVLSDGLSDVDASGDFALSVCGMGGDTASSVLSSEKARRARLIVVQPMTKEEHLRRFLWESGFEITREEAVAEGGKIYLAMAVIYTGKPTDYTYEETFLGKRGARVTSPDMARRLEHFHGRHSAIRHSIAAAGGDASQEDALVRAAEREILDIRERLK